MSFFLSFCPSLFDFFCLFPFGFSQEHFSFLPFPFGKIQKEENKRHKKDDEEGKKEKKEDEEEDDEEEQEVGEQFSMKLISMSA